MPVNCLVIDAGSVPYGDALALQRRAVLERQCGEGEDTLFFLEHPPVITIGRNADGSSLLVPEPLLRERGVALAEADRGGDVTFHGPGQLVGYPILALEPERRDIGRYIRDLEDVLMRSLAQFGVSCFRDAAHRGVWAEGGKIASVGVRIARWVTSHGFALNVTTDLEYFTLIHPCGIAGCRMTSMERELGAAPDMDSVKRVVAEQFSIVFGREMRAAVAARMEHEARTG
jgi:lipoyl(octanoyl) transferase